MNKTLKVLLTIGGVVLALSICVVIVILIAQQTIFNNIENKITNTPKPTETSLTNTPSVTKTVDPTDIVEVTPPDGWKVIDNTSQKYLAYRPNGWYYKMFPPAMETLGIDTTAIPDASEWAGLITMTRLSASNNLGSYKANLEAGFTENSQVISGNTWTIIKGKTIENEIYGSQFVKYAYVQVSGKEYLAGITCDATSSSCGNFNGQEATFDTFVSLIKFY